MSKGSKAPSSQTSTVNQSNLPEYAKPYFEGLLNATQSEIAQPYTPYGGPRIQGFSNDQQSAFGGIRSLASYGNPTTDLAASGAAGIYNPATSFGNFQAGQVGTQMFPGTDISGYMNPYIDNVLDRLQQRTQQNYAETQGNRNTAAQRAGAFGGSRQAIQDVLAQRDLSQQLGDQQANVLNQGYNQATGLWTSDQARRLQGDLANQQAQIGSANIGLQGLNTGLQSSQLLGALGNQQQNLAMDRLKALQATGQQEQQLGQTSLDQAYQDFVNQRDYGRNNLAFYSGILRGIPVSSESSTIQYQPAPNALSSALGSGISALSLGKALGT